MSGITTENVTLQNHEIEEKASLPKIIYVYDSMCGWCFGFSNVIYRIYEEYKDDFDFEVLSGGMIIGEGVTPAYKMKDFILKAYPRVEQTTGVKFGEPYLELFKEGSYILNSELASEVITVVKEIRPDLAFAVVKELQYVHFVLGHTLNSLVTYESILNKKGVNLNEFSRAISNPETKNKTLKEFAFVKQLGINGFPALLLLHKNKYYSISSGFAKYEDVKEIFDSVKENLANLR
ncbi:MAG: DsbA family protein [Candidatus Kapaibacteriota bacterium]|jgi:putative protein-disulfide isomerase